MVILMKLTMLKKNQIAKLVEIRMPKDDQRRLLHLGFYNGATIRFIRRAPMKDPSIYEICGNELILREQDARNIEVEVML